MLISQPNPNSFFYHSTRVAHYPDFAAGYFKLQILNARVLQDRYHDAPQNISQADGFFLGIQLFPREEYIIAGNL